MIDSHCHLEHPDFNKDLDEVIERAQEKLQAVITLADTVPSLQKTLDIAEKHKNFVHACLGLGPISALKQNKVNESIEFIRKHANKIVGIGEVGLDYYWDKTHFKQQEENFLKFIQLANELNKPIVVHSRDAEQHAFELIQKHAETTVILHSYLGPKEIIPKAIDAGCFLGITTKACRNPEKSLIKEIPLEYMLTETDSPFLHPNRIGRNEPANVSELVKTIAETLKTGEKEVDKTTTKNAEKAFKIKLSK